ncbi:MAG: valine--tRNA ligase [Flavobacteriaceae bacterium]|nr:valine--tRNA ligase [Flavobacteriaceae bacterium]
MSVPKKYAPQAVENKWYEYWMSHGFFHSEPDSRPAYTIVIPPPNVTGVLHMGHMLNNTIQDVLIRRARLKGFNACWVPGTDHASIATEAKVVAKLKAEGISKNDLSRDAFLEHAWEWTHKHGGIILEQLKKLGASCDWDRTKFTMDPDMSASVIKVFVDLYQKGLIYRGFRMVNWDPEAKTTLSDEEVIYEEKDATLYHIQYKIENSDAYVTIATTRPETIFGDTAICIHPEDERYTHLKGKKAIIPIAGKKIPIIEDDYVDREFGTGCLKVTPAHDPNDKEIGDRHQLEFVDIFNDDATLNQNGLHYEGIDRFDARKKIVRELDDLGHLIKQENFKNKVGTSERTKAVIEPKLSHQWFLKMENLVTPALKAVLEDKSIRLFPDKFENTYRHWLENIRDWNISRQLWWGQQIPAFYYGQNPDDFVVASNKEEALKLAREKSGNAALQEIDLTQDGDVLDTWFSSWLWPMSVFNGILEPENKDYRYYYPTTDLVTGPDILFFWVARMIFAGYEFAHEKPFTNVYLTGLVRDKQRRKMSKSLGNSPEPLELIENFGADGVRVGLLLSAPAGNDLMFDENLCEQGRNFANKIWNAFRLIQSWETDETKPAPQYASIALEAYESVFQKTLQELEDQFSKYRISDALMSTYKLVWDEFCSWLLEIVKPPYGEKIDTKTKQAVLEALENNLKLLHPFMPFITEEIWQFLDERTPEEALIVSSWPDPKSFDTDLIAGYERAKEIISGIRTIRKDKNIAHKEPLALCVLQGHETDKTFYSIVQKLANLASITDTDSPPETAISFRVGATEFFVPLSTALNVEEEVSKLTAEKDYLEGFLKSVRAKLANERFVNNAPEQVVALEKQKEQDALAKLETVLKSLKNLG